MEALGACVDDEKGVPCLSWEHMHLQGAPSWAIPCLDDSLERGRPNDARRSKCRMCSIRRVENTSASRLNPLARVSKIANCPRRQKGKGLISGAEDHWCIAKWIGRWFPDR
uniref:Uncharacterized protein n=1 Tax=Solanum tuberosum TaxID=4113 RepID=M1DIZ5_SOLTU